MRRPLAIILSAIVLVAIVGSYSCGTRGRVIGSRSADGGNYYLLIDTGGNEREIAVTREEYHRTAIGDEWPGE